jgi:phenylpropionate dioxygenase-like ring-hydroxylating dioxygenase large terminal subunit
MAESVEMADSTAQHTFPRGWFVVDMAAELGAGDVKALRHWGQEWVLFRTEEGVPVMMGAFCPHLGAHLGHGGCVKGEKIRCPFHAWEFDQEGACVAIPYAEKIPAQAAKAGALLVLPVREVNGLIFAWHDPEGGAPDHEIPAFDQWGDAGWSGWAVDLAEIATHPREIVENVADKAHFPVVHGTHVTEFENEFVGHMAVQRTKGVAYPRGGGEDPFELDATYHGPGYQITFMKGVIDSIFFQGHTPVDEGTLHLRFGVMLPMMGSAERTAKFASMYVDNLRTGFHEDIEIWENKKWREVPRLVDGDGPLGKLRVWYRQFYRPRAGQEA